MTHHGRKAYYIFSKGIRKLAFRTSEIGADNWIGWNMRVELLTTSQANNINDRDLYL